MRYFFRKVLKNLKIKNPTKKLLVVFLLFNFILSLTPLSLPKVQAALDPSELEYSISIGPISTTTSANYNYASFFNPSGSGRSVVIKNITVVSETSATKSYSSLTLDRITSASGGTQVAVGNIPKKNTASSDSILEVRHTGVTTGGGVTLSRILSQVTTRSTANHYSKRNISFGSNDEKIILQPSEGLRLYQEEADQTTGLVYINIEWEEVASTPSASNEYLFTFPRVERAAGAGTSLASFFNPSGSGKAAIVKRVWFGTETCDNTAVYTTDLVLHRISSASGGTTMAAGSIPKKNTSSSNSAMELRYATASNITIAASTTENMAEVTPCGTSDQPHGWMELNFHDNDEKLIIQPDEGFSLTNQSAVALDADQITRMMVEWQEVDTASTPASEGEYIWASDKISVAAALGTTFQTIHNPSGSGKTLIIKRLRFQIDAGAAAAYSAFNFQRISAVSGGTTITQSQIPKKHTGTSNSVADLRWCGASCASALTPTYLGDISTGAGGMSGSGIFKVNGPGAIGQKIGQREIVFGGNEKFILQEGEGLGMYLNYLAGSAGHRVKVIVEWDEEASTPSSQGEYLIDIGPVPGNTSATYNYATFFNPSGSGKTAIVKRASLRVDTVNTAVYVPITLKRITSASSGTQIALADIPKKHTSTANSVMEIRHTGVTVGGAGESILNLQTPGTVQANTRNAVSGYKEIAFDNQENIILQPGEGLVVQQTAAGSAQLRVKALFEWQEVDTASTPASEKEYLFTTGPIAGSLNANYVYSSFFNPSGNTKDYVVKMVDVQAYRHGTLVAPGYIPITARRITSASSGTLVTANTIPKNNSSTPDSTAEVRHTGVAVNFDGTIDSRIVSVLSPGITNGGFGQFEYKIVPGDELILKPGEGIALYQEAAAGDALLRYRFTLGWKEVSNINTTLGDGTTRPEGEFVWAKRMGGTGADYGLDIVTDNLGNVYTAGQFTGTVDFDPGVGTSNLVSAGNADTFVSKLDASGDFVWAKRVGGTAADYPNSMKFDSLGNVYILGTFSGTVDFDPGAGVFNLSGSGNNDIFILKLDSDGNFVWAKKIGGASQELAGKSSIDKFDNLYISGYFNGTTDFDPGAGVSNLSTAGVYDAFFVKLDYNGDFVWAKKFGGTSNDYPTDVVADDDGNVYMMGYFSGTADFDPGAGVFNMTASGVDAFIVKLDSNGDFVWAKKPSGSGSEYLVSIKIDSGGDLYISGYFTGTADFDPGAGVSNLISSGVHDSVILKLDSDGNFIWAKQFSGANEVVLNGGINIDNSGLYLSGYFEGTADFDPGAGTSNLVSAGSNDIFIAKLDSSGNFVWAEGTGGTLSDYPYASNIDNLGNIYTVGVFNGTADFDPGAGTSNLVSAGNLDVFVSKLTKNLDTNTIVGPSTGAIEIDRFSLTTNTGSDTVTGLTVTLGPTDAYTNIATVGIYAVNDELKCFATPSSNSVALTSCAIAVTTTPTDYVVKITPKTHANMPIVPGASYTTTALVTSITATNETLGSDTTSLNIIVDNLSPGNVTSATATGGNTIADLAWTNPVDSDLNRIIVLRRATTAVADVPVEGTYYSVGSTIGTSTVACVVTSLSNSCQNTGLINDTAYHYKIFTLDSRGNYDVGVVPTGSPVTPVAPTTTLGDGTDGGNSTIGPGVSATEINRFSLVNNTGSNNVTGMTVTLSGDVDAYTNITTVGVYTTGDVLKCFATPSSNSVALTSCAIAVTTTPTDYVVKITPKTHANMPIVPGASYATTATVTSITADGGYATAGTDTDSATITVDNLSPGNVTSATATAGNTLADLAWTNPVDSDLDKIIVLRRATNAVADVPVEGTNYSVGNTIGTATVACVITAPTATCQNTGLVNGTVYHYKIFTLDSRGNYDVGVVPTGSPVTPVDTPDRYWVGGTATWDATAGSKWASVSGGQSGASVPDGTGDVYFDASSGSGTVTIGGGEALAKNLIFTGFTGTLAGTGEVVVEGDLFLSSSMTNNFTGPITFNATSGVKNITTNNKNLNSSLYFDGVGGTWELVDDLNIIDSTKSINLINGILDANNNDINTGSFVFTGSANRTLDMGSGVFTMTGTGNVWDASSSTNLTINSDTSTIKITNNSSSGKTFAGGGKTYHTVWFDGETNTGDYVISGNNTFNTFKDSSRGAHAIKFTAGSTQTINTFDLTRNSGQLIAITSTNTSIHNLVSTGANIFVDFVNVSHSVATGTGEWRGGEYSVNNNNTASAGSGWVFNQFIPRSGAVSNVESSATPDQGQGGGGAGGGGGAEGGGQGGEGQGGGGSGGGGGGDLGFIFKIPKTNYLAQVVNLNNPNILLYFFGVFYLGIFVYKKRK